MGSVMIERGAGGRGRVRMDEFEVVRNIESAGFVPGAATCITKFWAARYSASVMCRA